MPALRRLLLAVTTVAVTASGCAGTSAVDQMSDNGYHFETAQKQGTLIPPAQRGLAGKASGQLLNGGTYRLSQDRGKITVVNFWGTWCPPCQIETPQFDQVYRQYKHKGVAFVGIDEKDYLKSQPRSFVAEHHISYPIVYDEGGRFAAQMGDLPAGGSFPFTAFLDGRGRVAAVYIGRLAPADLEPVLGKLLKERT